MSHRPSVKQPKPLSSPAMDPARMLAEAQNARGAQVLGEMKAEISPEAAPLWNFVIENARLIALGVLAVIALIIGVAAYHWYQESAANKAREELGRITTMREPAARLAALEAFTAAVPKGVQLAVHMELAAAAVQSENWDKAAAAYADVVGREKDTPLAFTAAMNRVDILMRQGKAAQALPELEALLPKAPKEIQMMINVQIGETAEAAGQPARAITAYQAVIAGIAPDAQETEYYKSRIDQLQ